MSLSNRNDPPFAVSHPPQFSHLSHQRGVRSTIFLNASHDGIRVSEYSFIAVLCRDDLPHRVEWEVCRVGSGLGRSKLR